MSGTVGKALVHEVLEITEWPEWQTTRNVRNQDTNQERSGQQTMPFIKYIAAGTNCSFAVIFNVSTVVLLVFLVVLSSSYFPMHACILSVD